MATETKNENIENTEEEVEMKTGLLSKVGNVVKNNKGKVVAGAALVGLGLVALLRKGKKEDFEELTDGEFIDCDEYDCDFDDEEA